MPIYFFTNIMYNLIGDDMKYENVYKGIFKERLNRFTCIVKIEGKDEKAHLKNTGRLKELLYEGNTVYLQRSSNPERKTKYDIISAEKLIGEKMIIVNIDSQRANDTAEEWLKKSILFSENAKLRREVTYKNSRFDFYIEDGERKVYLEVKGCTLERDGVAYFPDAPTLRGVKHIGELCECVKDGFDAYILFVIQMKGIKKLCPNNETHKEFGDALRSAQKRGVGILAVDCITTHDSVFADAFVPVEL